LRKSTVLRGQSAAGRNPNAKMTMSRAIERTLEIVSEAVRAIPEDWLKAYPDVRWDRIRGMGNFLRREYHLLDGDVIWDAVKTKVPEIRFAIAEMPEKSGE
jgi:uncharacterized protein with HEPN domain